MMTSISSIDMPASAMAFLAALTAMVEVDSSLAARRRSLMPVRVTIHSSLVSRYSAKCALVRISWGAYEPVPQIVIGNSGVKLDNSPPHGSHEITVDRASARVLTTRDVVRYKKKKTIRAFGYLDVSFSAGGEWEGKLIDATSGAGIHLAKCGTKTRRKSGSICELAKGVKAK